MASERPEGHINAPDLRNVLTFPGTSRVPRECIDQGSQETAVAESAPRIAPVIRLFTSSKTLDRTRKLSEGATISSVDVVLARSMVNVVGNHFYNFGDQNVKQNVIDRLTVRALTRRQKLSKEISADILVQKAQIKEVKEALLQDLLLAFAEMNVFHGAPIVKINNYPSDIDSLQTPIGDIKFDIMSFYKKIFETYGGLISPSNFKSLNQFFSKKYWMFIKREVRKSGEYQVLHSLIGDDLDKLFLQFRSLENLMESNDHPIVAAWSQLGSLREFVLSVSKKKPDDHAVKHACTRINDRYSLLGNKMKRASEIGFRMLDSRKDDLLTEIQAEIGYAKNFIQDDVFEVKDTSNVILLSARTDQLRTENEVILQVEEMLKGQAIQHVKVFLEVFNKLLQFILKDVVKRTAFYRSMGKWSPEVLDSFSNWIFAIVYQDSMADRTIMTPENVRARITNILSSKAR